MTVERGYYVRQYCGAEWPDPNHLDLYKRLKEGEAVEVPYAPMMKNTYVFYRRAGSTTLCVDKDGGTLQKRTFNIYFRKPTQEELAWITLSQLDKEG